MWHICFAHLVSSSGTNGISRLLQEDIPTNVNKRQLDFLVFSLATLFCFLNSFFFLVVISHSTSSHRPCTRLIIVSYFHRMLSAFGIWVLFNKTLRWWGEALTTRISPLWKSFITSHFDWRSALSWMRKLRDIITSFRQRRTYKVWEGRALGQRDKRDKELIEICSFGFYFVRAIWEPRERVVNCVNNRRFVSLFAIHDIYNLSNSQGRRLPLTKRYDWFALKMENEDFLICSQ